MTALALTLVLSSAVLHATWNLSAKRAAGGDDVAFVWLMSLVSTALALPFGLASWVADPPPLGPLTWLAVAASGVVHGVYFLVLQQGYRRGDLSVVYPVARGTGPLFAVVAAVVLLGERPGVVGSIGVAAVLVGIVLVSGLVTISGGQARSAGVGWGTLTGLWIAAYTVIDAWAVAGLGLSPFVFFSLSLTVTAIVLAPLALGRRAGCAMSGVRAAGRSSSWASSRQSRSRSCSSRCGSRRCRMSPPFARCR